MKLYIVRALHFNFIHIMFVVIVLALLILGNDAQQCSDTRDTPPVLNCGSSYDFIVVGAGIL